MKPYKGEINHWRRVKTLDGYYITGVPIHHPKFTNWIKTSRVVKFNAVTLEIETMNSIYRLIGKEVIVD